MNKYATNNGDLYIDGTIYELKVANGTEFKVQGVGGGSFQLVGKLKPGSKPKVISLIKMKDYDIVETITDDEIYCGDAAGLYSISVQNVSGFEKIWTTILSGD